MLLNENDIAGASSGVKTCCVLSTSASCDDALFAFSVDLNGSENYSIHIKVLRDSCDEETGLSTHSAQVYDPLTRTSGQFVWGKCWRSADGGDTPKVCVLQIWRVQARQS